MQRDLKAFLAFSRIVHINFLVFNYLIINKIRKFSSFVIIISHGFISTILFYLVGEIYKYNNSRLFYFMKRVFFNN
jgi:NADH:ubiquinone oxidoreductase subunit 4 (subunit M)